MYNNGIELALIQGELHEKEMQRQELQEQLRNYIQETSQLRTQLAVAEEGKREALDQLERSGIYPPRDVHDTSTWKRFTRIVDAFIVSSLQILLVLGISVLIWQSLRHREIYGLV